MTSSANTDIRAQRRLIAMTIVILVAVGFVIWWSRREAEQAATPATPDAGSATTAPATDSGSAIANEKFRKIDKPTRSSILERLKTARDTRTGSASASASSSATTPKPALPPLPGKLEASEIRKAVRDIIPLLAECYDAALPRLTKKTGKVVFNMHMTGEPAVGTLIEYADLSGDDHFVKDAELAECFQQTMMSIEFPPTAEGTDVYVTYPMEFSPGD